MGCSQFKSSVSVMVNGKNDVKLSANIPYISESDKVVIQNNWQGLKLHIANIGVLTYVSMFESHPDMIKTFSTFEGKDFNKLHECGLLQQHAVRVMSTIDKCIIHINDPSSMEKLLQEVGEHHKMYNVRSTDIQIILPHFLTAMKPYSQDPWCDELENVWTRFLSLIVYHIKKAMRQNDVKGIVSLGNNKQET